MTKLPLQPYFMNVFGHYKTLVKTNSKYSYAGMRDWVYQEYGAVLDVSGDYERNLIIFESDSDALLFALRFA